MRNGSSRGYTILELLTVVAIIGMFVVVTVPAFGNIQRRAALRAASTELRAIFHLARSRAISRNANCGVRFFKAGGEWHFTLYDDGDRDGVRTDDIKKGIDRPVGTTRVVFPESKSIVIGLPPKAIKDPAGKVLSPSTSPVKFSASSICSFSPLGESSPGTIYLTDQRGAVFAVRVFGGSARIRLLRYDATTGKWVS